MELEEKEEQYIIFSRQYCNLEQMSIPLNKEEAEKFMNKQIYSHTVLVKVIAEKEPMSKEQQEEDWDLQG